MAEKREPFTWTGWGMRHANEHATAASTYLQKLSRAAHPHDRSKAHAEFVKMHLDMCEQRAEILYRAVEAANTFMGNFVQVLAKHKDLADMVRTSPKRKSRSTKARRR